MPKTNTGNRAAHFGVQIVEDGNRIHLFFKGYDVGVINFKRSTGMSGSKAYERLSKILDMAEAKDTTQQPS